MAKYSTGSDGASAGESCELCGADDEDLQTVTVAGATLSVCADCARHGDGGAHDKSTGGQTDGERGSSGGADDRRRRAARNTARMHDARQGDSSHWEDGAGYDEDQLPYLVSEYGQRVRTARQDAGLQTQELADELDIDEVDLLSVEQGRATKAGVGGSVITSLEERLDIQLAEQA